jgi:hypothetical protein
VAYLHLLPDESSLRREVADANRGAYRAGSGLTTPATLHAAMTRSASNKKLDRSGGAMRMKRFPFWLALAVLGTRAAAAQIDESEVGAWYTYAWNAAFEERRFGFQGDVQYRNWDSLGDLEQLLLRGGITFRRDSGRTLFTAGLAHITTGAYGASGATIAERRLYQEALVPGRIGRKVYLTHRFRFEQRWLDGQDFRTRLRYFFGVNIALNQDTLSRGATYLALYNELFANLETDIGDGRRVDNFDRNRLQLAVGRSLTDDLRLQVGYMFQQTETVGKGQLQLNLIQTF